MSKQQGETFEERQERVLRELKPAVDTVNSWPEWKQNIMGTIHGPRLPSEQPKSFSSRSERGNNHWR